MGEDATSISITFEKSDDDKENFLKVSDFSNTITSGSKIAPGLIQDKVVSHRPQRHYLTNTPIHSQNSQI